MAPDAEQLDNATINADISKAANGTNFGELLLARGQAIVYLDDEGRIVTRRPGSNDEEARC